MEASASPIAQAASQKTQPNSRSQPRNATNPSVLGSLPLPRLMGRLGLVLLAVGLVCRLGRYLLSFPVWGDEAMLCLNFLERDFLGLTRQLEYAQIAPILFLWGEAAAFRLFGSTELAMRLIPFLAGASALVLFWSLARKTVRPMAALFALGLLAVGRWPVTMSCNIKPYSVDLLMAVALLLPATTWLHRPQRCGWLWLLAFIGPLATAASYPSIFIVAGIILTLAWPVWRLGRPAMVPFFLFSSLAGASFLACYLLVGKELGHTGAPDAVAGMQVYWAHGFPPASPVALLRWLLLTHTGRMMAYPVGDGNGASALTFLLFLVGVWTWWRAGRRSLLLLALLPFALNLLAAALKLYPYGACCRLSQHLAPAVCLLAGSGLASCLERWWRTDELRRRAVWAVFGLLALCAVAGLAVDLYRPYRDPDALWARAVVAEVMKQAKPADQVVVLNAECEVFEPFRWDLRRQGQRVAWAGEVNWDGLQSTGGRLLCLKVWTDPSVAARQDIFSILRAAPTPMKLALEVPFAVPPSHHDDPVIHCDLYVCAKAQDAENVRRTMEISAIPMP